MANTNERAALKNVYTSRKWRRSVDAMSDSQVFAIYMRFKNANKI